MKCFSWFPTSFWIRLVVLVLGMGVISAGCSTQPKKFASKGTVTYKGAPVPAGTIKFFGPDNKDSVSAASIREDGTFDVTELQPGEYKVTVDTAFTGGSGGQAAPSTGGTSAPKKVDIPQKYWNTATSGLKYTITPETKLIEIKFE